MKIETRSFGEGEAKLFAITNDNGLVFEVSDFGARIVRLLVPNETGDLKNIILGFATQAEYKTQDTYFGASIGRVAGRLRKGLFNDGTTTHQLNQNEGANTLHGGKPGFDEKIWRSELVQDSQGVKIIFTTTSPAGENGFPGNLTATVTYTFNNDNEWRIDYGATTDAATLYNPTNHVYFNLSGDLSQSIGEHQLFIDADTFAVLDDESLPTGELRPVAGTSFDFISSATASISQTFSEQDQQAKLVNGIDHPFCLNSPSLAKAQVKLNSPASGISLSMRTNAPAVVVYTTNMLENSLTMFNQEVSQHGGVTLETQALPDAINHDGFGSIILTPEQPFTSTTIYKIQA